MVGHRQGIGDRRQPPRLCVGLLELFRLYCRDALAMIGRGASGQPRAEDEVTLDLVSDGRWWQVTLRRLTHRLGKPPWGSLLILAEKFPGKARLWVT